MSRPLRNPFRANAPVSPYGVLLFLAWLLTGAGLWAWSGGLLAFVFVLLGWLVALVVHEFGHAVVAHRGGDHTVGRKGYLTLNPVKYADPFISLGLPLIVLALGGLGLPGAAVYLRQDLMRGRKWRSLAALGGPLGTLIVLILLAVALALLGLTGPQGEALRKATAFLAFLQATALILNLLPVPGLDGYGALRPWLPRKWVLSLIRVEHVAIFLLIGVLFLVPGAGSLLIGSAVGLAGLFGIDPDLVATGWNAFRFWI
ncbi:site-2 protease family protein [Brevundimonas diminuta]|uniref:site-2 protease family protein n=1 Tax=Brevundimonas diminuta TaxID=293 RepID=UPI0030F52A43